MAEGESFMGMGETPADLENLIRSSLYAAGRSTRDQAAIDRVLKNVDMGKFYRNRQDPTVINDALVKAGLPGTSAQALKAYTSQPSLNRGLAWEPQDVAQHHIDATRDLAKNPGVLQLGLTALGGAALGSAYGGGAAATGTGSAAAGGSAAGGTGLTGAAGGTGLSATGSGLGLTPAATGASGLSGSYATGALAPNYFAAEGALAAGAGAGAGAGFGGGSAAASGGGGVPAGAAAPAAGAAVPAVAGGGSALSALTSNPQLLGMGAGALLGGMGGSEQAGTIKTEEGIPDWLQPYVKPALDKYSTDLQNYQIDPMGIMPSAMQEFQNTISGMYLDPSTNKYLEDYFRLGSERVKGSLSPSFGHMQAFGQHSGYNEALSRGLGDLAVGLYGGAYEKERDRQAQFTGAAPGFLANSSTAAFAPYQQYLQSVGSLGKKREEPYFENPFGNILGGAMLGGSFGSMFK